MTEVTTPRNSPEKTLALLSWRIVIRLNIEIGTTIVAGTIWAKHFFDAK